VRFSHSAVNSQTRSLRLWRQSTFAYCSQGVRQVFTAAVYRAHCAVIFAIAQLSCLYLVQLTFMGHSLGFISVFGRRSRPEGLRAGEVFLERGTETPRAGLRYCGALSTWQSGCPPRGRAPPQYEGPENFSKINVKIAYFPNFCKLKWSLMQWRQGRIRIKIYN